MSVEDNGRGIPCSFHEVTKKSALETVLCVLHAGGKFGGDESGYKVSGGLHGVGISVVNALSETMLVEVARDGNLHSLRLCRGKPVSQLDVKPLVIEENSMVRGTRVQFKPDPEIFKTTLEFEYEKLANRLDELAYLNPGLTITFKDERNNARIKVNFPETLILSDDEQVNLGKATSNGPLVQVYRHVRKF